jgi:dTDP-L-rhamnose 4-epimerase
VTRVLVTGGAGFIGSFVADALIEDGFSVRILDNLEEQIHGNKKPYINEKAEFMRGDVRLKDDWKKALKDVDMIAHLAAMVGVGQSMYQPVRYFTTNIIGTSNMYEVLDEIKMKPQAIFMASSMIAYGEGLYECKTHGKVYPLPRPKEQLEKKEWELKCPICGEVTKPLPTPEEKPPQNLSIYALAKYAQERIAMMNANVSNIPTIAFRPFNVFGARQSLTNYYGAVNSNFLVRIKNNNAPIVFEDGLQSRDFIYVTDVADAVVAALKSKKTGVYNIGSGKPTAIKRIADILIELMGKKMEASVTGEFRPMDLRHCYSDNTKIKRDLNFRPKVSVEEGLGKFVDYYENTNIEDKTDKVIKELKDHGLLK